MGESNNLERVELTLPSVLEYVSLANAVAEEIVDHLGADEETRDAISNSVVEATTNAIEHGNGLDRTKRVHILFRSSTERIEIHVRDEGTGFDPTKIADPRTPDNLMRERGRGIFILRAFMDEVRFRFDPSRGTTVMMVRAIVPASPNGN